MVSNPIEKKSYDKLAIFALVLSVIVFLSFLFVSFGLILLQIVPILISITAIIKIKKKKSTKGIWIAIMAIVFPLIAGILLISTFFIPNGMKVDPDISKYYQKSWLGDIYFTYTMSGDNDYLSSFSPKDRKSLKEVNKRTFQVLSSIYAKDKNNCYFKGEPIPNCDPNSFAIIYENDKGGNPYIFLGFSKDKNRVYYNLNSINDADANSFEVIDNLKLNTTINSNFEYISKDRNNVYLLDKTIDKKDYNLDLEKLKIYVYKEGYYSAKNYLLMKNGVYFINKSISKPKLDKFGDFEDPLTFEMLSRYYAKDSKSVYYIDEVSNKVFKIEGSDLTTFELINLTDTISKDKNNIYSKNNVLKIDKESMQIISRGILKDKYNVYLDGQILNGANPESFKVIPYKRLYSINNEDNIDNIYVTAEDINNYYDLRYIHGNDGNYYRNDSYNKSIFKTS